MRLIFVYGTLQRGEARSRHMRGSRLCRAMEVPGRLYDTGLGYPAAVFDRGSPSTVAGELYVTGGGGEKLAELDAVEAAGSGLFKRVAVRHGGLEFQCYEPGPLLKGGVRAGSLVPGGSWRIYSSRARSDPADFALRFEEHLRDTYKVEPDAYSDGLVFHRGHIPVLVTAPHATAHTRMEKLKRQEFYTGALTVILHSLTGSHALYTDRLLSSDPNYYDGGTFKGRVAEIAERHDIGLLVDLHGTGAGRAAEIFPGTGIDNEFLLGNHGCMRELEAASGLYGINLGGPDVFPASRQMTVAKFAALELGVPSIQLEIARTLRQPDKNPVDFVRLTGFLSDFIAGRR